MDGIEEMLETKGSFSDKVIDYCKKNELTYVEGLQEYLISVGIEIEDAPALLTNELKALIYKEATDKNMFKISAQKITFDD